MDMKCNIILLGLPIIKERSSLHLPTTNIGNKQSSWHPKLDGQKIKHSILQLIF
jgi:hypothetical protein